MVNIKVGDSNHYGTIAEILNKVFGIPVKQYRKGYYQFSSGKRAVFFHLAERGKNGGWKPPNKNYNWLNIPDSNKKAFTQIELNKDPEFFKEAFTKGKVAAKEQAVFMGMKDPQTGKSRYFFYGVFTAQLLNTANRICIYTRRSAVLKPAGWLGTMSQ